MTGGAIVQRGVLQRGPRPRRPPPRRRQPGLDRRAHHAHERAGVDRRRRRRRRHGRRQRHPPGRRCCATSASATSAVHRDELMDALHRLPGGQVHQPAGPRQDQGRPAARPGDVDRASWRSPTTCSRTGAFVAKVLGPRIAGRHRRVGHLRLVAVRLRHPRHAHRRRHRRGAAQHRRRAGARPPQGAGHRLQDARSRTSSRTDGSGSGDRSISSDRLAPPRRGAGSVASAVGARARRRSSSVRSRLVRVPARATPKMNRANTPVRAAHEPSRRAGSRSPTSTTALTAPTSGQRARRLGGHDEGGRLAGAGQAAPHLALEGGLGDRHEGACEPAASSPVLDGGGQASQVPGHGRPGRRRQASGPQVGERAAHLPAASSGGQARPRSEQRLLVAEGGVDRRRRHQPRQPAPGQVVHEHPAAAVDRRGADAPAAPSCARGHG